MVFMSRYNNFSLTDTDFTCSVFRGYINVIHANVPGVGFSGKT